MTYVFASCELDTRLYTLRRAGRVCPLRPKVFQVLLYLLDHSDRVVSKQELIKHAWPGQFISEATLEGCVKQVRQALGDSGRAQRLLQTLHGHGYRIIVPVERFPDTAQGLEAASGVLPRPEVVYDDAASTLLDVAASLPEPPGPLAPPARQELRHCLACRHANSMPAVFCVACGTRLMQSCAHCGQQVHFPAAFCSACGQPLAGLVGSETTPSLGYQLLDHTGASALLPQGLQGGERKLVTVLCCALSNALGPGERLELDALHSAMRELYALARSEIQRYGGTLRQVTGDRFTAVFGVPMAQEDHIQRAVLAALGLQRRLGERSQVLGGVAGALTVCLGLHTGAVVVGGIGDDSELAATLVGDTALLASALQDMAAPGTILCSEAVARLAQDVVRCEAVPPRSGQGAIMPAYTVLGLRPRRMRMGRHEGQPVSRLIGRALELATLQALLEQISGGQGHVVGIVGEPGIGKSRLLAEFRHTLREVPVTYLAGRCVSYNSMTPYGLVADLLRHNCGVTESDSPDILTARVHHSLQEVGMGSDAAPYLLHLLGVAVAAEQFVGLSAEAVKARTFEMLLQMSIKGSQRRPLIVEIEDLHWSDATSEEYLAAFVERLAGMPILVLATYRPGYHPSWLEKSYVTQLALRRLSLTQGQEMMQALLQDTQLPAPLVQEIAAKADGNPFFLEELAQTVRESGASALSITVPDTIQAVLAARIDRLPPAEKRLLQVAAVIGKDVTFPLLQAVMALSDTSLHQHLRHLQAAEFFYERPMFPTPLYTFKHALTQEVAYQSLLYTTRQQYHRQIAQILTERFAETVEPQPELLAHHYTEAGFCELAITFWYQAGVRASARSACVEAIAHLTRGLAVLPALPESPERLQHELDFQTILAPALMAIRSPVAPEVEQAYARAYILCQQVGPNPKLVWALEGLWAFHLVRGKFQTAQELGQQLMRLAQHVHTPLAFVVAHQALGLIAFYRGEFGSALEHFQQGVATYDPQHSRARAVRGVNDPGVMCAAFAALALCVLGYPDQGLQHSQAMLRMAQEVAHPHSLAFARCAAAVAHQCRRDSSATLEQAEAAVTLAREQGFPLWAAMGEVLGGWALAIQGHGTDGTARIQRGLAVWRATGAENVQPYFLTLLADACRVAGQVEAGLQALADALTVANTTGERWWEAETYRLRGELLQADTRHAGLATEVALRQALTLAQQQGGKLWELRAAVSLSRLLASQGQSAEARQVVHAVYACFTEGGDTVDLQEARAQLEALS